MKVGLFIPCYINAVFPEVGISTFKLLQELGYEVEYPKDQTCCGQPMANAGYEMKSKTLVRHMEDLFGSYDCVVGPSASCVSFVREVHPRIAREWGYSCHVASTIRDIIEFLHDDLRISELPSTFPHKVSIHNSCHGVRQLGLSTPSEQQNPYHNKIRNLLSLVKDIEIYEPSHIDECCGFGGLFSVEEDKVSCAMGRDKIQDHLATGAEYITGPDSSCLMHMQGIIDRSHYPIQTIHSVQILAANL